MEFAIGYRDLSVVRGETRKEWDAAPQDGVLHVVTSDGVCRPSDFYSIISGEPHGSSSPYSLLHYFSEVKFGATVDSGTFKESTEIAKAEMKSMCGCKLWHRSIRRPMEPPTAP